MFYALGKLKAQSDKVRMVKTLMESESIDLGLVNCEKKTCYEVHNDSLAYDEASSMIERAHLKGKERGNHSTLFIQDFSDKHKQQLLDRSLKE